MKSMVKCSSVAAKSLITFCIQNALNKLTHHPQAASKVLHTAMDICSKAVHYLLQCFRQPWICFGYSMVFVWPLQTTKMLVNLMTY